jgi:hypothetical protein
LTPRWKGDSNIAGCGLETGCATADVAAIARAELRMSFHTLVHSRAIIVAGDSANRLVSLRNVLGEK